MIPIIDFSDYGLDKKDSSTVGMEKLKNLGQKMKDAFSSMGDFYLENHGVREDLIANYRQISREFFEQPLEAKQPYARVNDTISGWVATDTEKLNPERPGDYKETFNYCPSDHLGNWPNIPVFEAASKAVFKDCTTLYYRISNVLSVGMGLQKDFMKDAHKLIGKHGNSTTLRSVYYPPITEDAKLKPGQIRLGEHSDYGTITLLFQDEIGGLEVQIPGAGYIPATPIPGTALVIIGDLMQRWTADNLLATKHRLLLPEEEFRKQNSGQSIMYFVQPDDDFVVNCLDGSNKYEPISGRDYLNSRFSVSYY